MKGKSMSNRKTGVAQERTVDYGEEKEAEKTGSKKDGHESRAREKAERRQEEKRKREKKSKKRAHLKLNRRVKEGLKPTSWDKGPTVDVISW